MNCIWCGLRFEDEDVPSECPICRKNPQGHTVESKQRYMNKCQECGDQMVPEEGCAKCHSCGNTLCG